MQCSNCGAQSAQHDTTCECGNFLGYPNVRKSQEISETTALSLRTQNAINSAVSLGTLPMLQAFSDDVQRNSVALIARDIGTLDSLSRSDNSFYVSYHRQVRAGTRTPQDNKYDAVRAQVDAALFPNYHEHIMFASLSLNDVGDTNYGSFFLTLKDNMVSMRASVFEGNSLEFAEKEGFKLTAPIPPGYRAPWGLRNDLAVAKLHHQIGPATTEADHPGILFDASSGDPEFVEVHIYGKLGIGSVAKVTGVTPMTREDKALWKIVKRRFEGRGIIVQEH